MKLKQLGFPWILFFKITSADEYTSNDDTITINIKVKPTMLMKFLNRLTKKASKNE